MDFLDSLTNLIESLAPKTEGEINSGAEHIAKRMAATEQEWVRKEIGLIIIEAAMLSQSADLAKVEAAMTARLTKFAEECFTRGAKAASRLNVITE